MIVCPFTLNLLQILFWPYIVACHILEFLCSTHYARTALQAKKCEFRSQFDIHQDLQITTLAIKVHPIVNSIPGHSPVVSCWSTAYHGHSAQICGYVALFHCQSARISWWCGSTVALSRSHLHPDTQVVWFCSLVIPPRSPGSSGSVSLCFS
jgi:hypothetical protein